MRIGEFSARSGVSARMLRHYEKLGLIEAAERSSAGYREYRETDLARIFHIESLRTLGMSLSEVKEALDDPDFRPSELLSELIRDTRDRLRRDRELLSRLRAVQEVGPADWDSVLELIGMLRQLRSPEAAQRQRAAFDAGSGRHPPVETLAEAALREENLNVAGALRWALRQSGEAGLSAIARRSNHPEPRIRRRVMRILGEEAASPSARVGLRHGLVDPDEQVRQLAALALREPAAAPLLVEMILAGHHDVEAAEALAALPDSKVYLSRLQVEVEQRTAGDPARARLTQALAEFRGPEVIEVLRGLCGDAERQVALTAAAILRQRGEGIP